MVSRTANAILSVIVLVVASTSMRPRSGALFAGSDPEGGRTDRRVVLAVATAGLLDVLGLLAFSYGLEVAQTWLVGLASSFGPAVTILVAVVALGERLRSAQWIGLGAVAAGVVLIGLP